MRLEVRPCGPLAVCQDHGGSSPFLATCQATGFLTERLPVMVAVHARTAAILQVLIRHARRTE